MTTKELTRNLAKDCSITQKAAKVIVKNIFTQITIALRHGESVVINDFGHFVIKHYRERNGRNPMTGEKILIHARNKILFKAFKKLRELIK